MKKRFSDLSFVLTLLQVCSVLAALGAAGVIFIACRPHLTDRTPWLILECLLWSAAWVDFFRMCRRLKTEPSAFTEKNARTLLVIAVCCGLIGVMQLIPWLRDLLFLRTYTFLASLLMLLPPTAFLGVAAVGLTLRGLLKRAMALEKESELTI